MREQFERLVFLDETGTNTKLTRTRGRCLNGGRLFGKAPFGYRKETVTFSDALAAVRRQLWADETFAMSPASPDPPKVAASLLERLTELACYAA